MDLMRGDNLASKERTVVFAGALGTAQHPWERSLRRQHGSLVLCCGGRPEDVMRQCRKLLPCVLVVDQAFVDSVDCGEFEQVVDFGQAIQVLVATAAGAGAEAVEKLLRMGCSGVLHHSAPVGVFQRALRAVASGELWACRKTSSILLRSLLREDKRKLTGRENQILLLVREGLTNAAIAKRLFISTQTVRWHLRSIYGKLGVHDRPGAGIEAAGTRKDRAVALTSTGRPGVLKACAGCAD